MRKSPSTIIAILEKSLKVQNCIETASLRMQYGFDMQIKGKPEMRQHYAKRIEINAAIIKRLEAYYDRLHKKAENKSTVDVDFYAVHTMD